ncbi:MAG: thrombospondin type 3 repeat-containing protein [Patescibacteria group bacterium]
MEDYSSQSGLHRRRLILIGAGIVLVVLVVIFIVIFFVQRNRAQVSLRIAEEQMQSLLMTAESACNVKNDPISCNANVRAELAQESGNVDYCTPLSGDAYDRCVQFSIFTSGNTEDCALIVGDEARTRCEQTRAIVEAADSSDVKDCEAIEDATFKQSCIDNWIVDQLLAGNCEPKQITDELCAVSQQLRDAIVAEDPDMCLVIALENYQGVCIEQTLPGDRDHDNIDATTEEQLGTSDILTDSDADGLSDADEIERGTNPADADSDNDGYNDGVEVYSGYNPLGSGTL